ncbi:MAG: hypothetical protein K2O95_07625 [Clostridia bacterium]|nr:hypothetical protein [Clostridia bacterium]MDE7079967.1 hypothetical protein [Clostridia bacterium]
MRSYEIVATLSSKEKEVFKVRSQGEDYILKVYPDEQSADKEVDAASKVSMTGYAPRVVEREGNKALFEYIEGDNFNEVFRLATMTDDVQTMEMLASRLSIFLQMIYSFSDNIMKKIDFNNFLVKDGRVIGVDFSQVDDGMPYEDLASAITCALFNSVGEYYSCFPFIQKMLDCFKLSMMDVINEIKLRLEQVSKRTKESVDVEFLLDSLANFDEKGVDWRKLI